MSINWSNEQREVINSNDDRLLVSASAGSGKTTVMIERVMRLIGDGNRLANMLICTFTKASAADMRTKLYAEMSKRSRDGELSAEPKERYKNELKELSRADISTIDSFCQRLVSKYFYVLGIDPQFEVLDDGESTAMKNDAIDRCIVLCRQNEAFSRLYEILLSGRKSTILHDAIREIINFSEINPDVRLRFVYDDKAQDKIKEILDGRAKELYDKINKFFSIVDEPVAKADLLSALMGRLSPECKVLKSKENKIYGEFYKYIKDEVRDFNALRNAADEFRSQTQSKEFIEALIDAAKTASKLYSDEKSKRAAVDFADLENMALKILRSDVVSEIRGKYKYVFVDEYQDINPLQEEIISLVSEGNSLFMVGDIKQSIYAFRGCDPGIFKAKYDLYRDGKGGRVISLDSNYRSGKKIIDFVNDVFGRIMTEKFGGIDYISNPMSTSSDKDGYVKFHIAAGKDDAETEEVYSVQGHMNERMSKSEAEAYLVAQRVGEVLKSGAKYGDIAILTRSMDSLAELVVRDLRKISVPVSLTEDAEFLTRPETGQLIDFMRLVDNPYDDKALAASMLSPFGGFNENELAQLRSGTGTFFECVAASISDAKVKAFFGKLNRYSALALTMGADELAGTIVSENGYFNYAFGLGDDAAEVLDKFLEFLGTCPKKSSLSACIRYIDEHRPYAELKGADDSVKLMTIHKSKGLEFKYVFVIGLGDTFNVKDLSKQIMAGDPLTMNVYDDHVAYNSDMRFLACENKRKKMFEEELRILYVAFTRAKEGLELFASMSGEAQKFIGAYECTREYDLVDFSSGNSALKLLAPQTFWAKKYDVNEIEVKDAETRKVFFSAADPKDVERLRAYFDFSPKSNAPAKSYVSKLAHKDDEPAVYLSEEYSEGDALERGNAYHRAMEKLDFESPDLSTLPPADLALINTDKLLLAARNMLRFAGKTYKEKPFIFKLKASEIGFEGDGDVLVQGVIDLMILDGDKATIVDYKTGAIHGPFEEGYFKQVNLYAKAVERLLGKKVVGKYLYYFDAATFVEIS